MLSDEASVCEANKRPFSYSRAMCCLSPRRDTTYCKFFLALGHLYDIARQQVVSVGRIAHPSNAREEQQQQQRFGEWPADPLSQDFYSQFLGHYAGASSLYAAILIFVFWH